MTDRNTQPSYWFARTDEKGAGPTYVVGRGDEEITHPCLFQHEAQAIVEALRAALAQGEPGPDRTGMTYYKNNACKAPSANSPDCICWTPMQKPVVWMYQDKSTNEVRFQKHMRDFVDHGATYEL
ncbi:MAG: hypothetical protein ACRCWC_09225, partial [Plesiomonas shigelloides]